MTIIGSQPVEYPLAWLQQSSFLNFAKSMHAMLGFIYHIKFIFNSYLKKQQHFVYKIKVW